MQGVVAAGEGMGAEVHKDIMLPDGQEVSLSTTGVGGGADELGRVKKGKKPNAAGEWAGNEVEPPQVKKSGRRRIGVDS